MIRTLSREELEAAHVWEPADHVPGRPAMTEYRRLVRCRQARWREANGHPMGTEPIVPRPGDHARLLGSRLPLDYARETGANFLTAGALAAATARSAVAEPYQTVDHRRLWADLLWAPALAVNLFGEAAADLSLADRVVRRLWPDVPGRVSAVRFEHSPARLDPSYLNSLRAWDAAFILDREDGTRGIVAVDVKHYDWTKPETPKPENRWRQVEVADWSGAFAPGAIDSLKVRSGLCLMWLEHLLLLSALQHPSGAWSWGKYVVVYPAGNADFAEATERYRGFLADDSTFGSMTLEELLDSGALPPSTEAAVRERYLAEW